MYRPARPRWSDSEKRAGSKDVVSPSCAHHKTPHPRSHSSRHIIDSSRSKLFESLRTNIKLRSRALRPREAGRRPRGVSTPGGSACRDVCARGRARVVRVRVSRVSLCYFVAVCLCRRKRDRDRRTRAHGGRVGGCGMRMGYLRCGPCSSMLQQERSQERDAASVHAGVRERPATEVRVLGLLVLPPRAARGCGSRSQRGTLCLRGVEPPSQIFSSTLYQCRAAPLLSPHLSLSLSLARAPPSDLHITSNGDGAF